MKKKHWYDYLWIWTTVYFILGFFNILFAWLGLIDFLVPLFIAALGGGKAFCNRYCGRGQLFAQLGGCKGCSANRKSPSFLASKWFRYGFLVFFLTMFGSMLLQTWQVAAGAENLKEAIKLLWLFRVPWDWAYTAGTAPDWVAKFAFGFYSLMLTSTIIGLTVMALFKPRTWCVFCPMGTMTQMICKIRERKHL